MRAPGLGGFVVATIGMSMALGTPASAAWYTFHRLIPSPNGSFYFGASMAAVDDRFLVGDPGDGTGGPFTGAVHLVDARTGEFLRTIVHPDPQPYGQFGLTVALRGTDVVVGAPQQPVGGLAEVGVVYVFDGPTGTLRYTIPNPTPAAGDVFGQALAANDTDILVGARGDGDPITAVLPSPGAAYLFDGATGALRHAFAGPSPLAMSFGAAVGFVGADPLIGAVNDTSRALFEGGAYLFDRSSGALRQALHTPTPQPGSGFGSRVGGIGGQPVVAAVFDDLVRPDAGAIYLFDATGSAAGAFPNPVPEHVEPGGIGQVTLDAIDDRLLAAGFYHYSDLSTPGGDSVHVIDTQTGDVLQTLEAPEPFGTELAATYLIASNERIVVSSFGQLFVFDPVGNSFLGSGEECDDGNTADGDGCSARARIETPPCAPVPRTDCHPAAARSARLVLRRRADDRRDALKWRLPSGAGMADLGDPTAGTSFVLCIYDGAGGAQPWPSFALPGGGQCDGTACWRTRGGGFAYRDRVRTPDGIGTATLKPTASGGIVLTVVGRGENLDLPALPLGLPAEVQLVRGDGAGCWTSTFSTAAVNDANGVSARGD